MQRYKQSSLVCILRHLLQITDNKTGTSMLKVDCTLQDAWIKQNSNSTYLQ